MTNEEGRKYTADAGTAETIVIEENFNNEEEFENPKKLETQTEREIPEEQETNLSDFALFLTVMKNKSAYRNTLSIILDEKDIQLRQ